jgi:hypothetical protein
VLTSFGPSLSAPLLQHGAPAAFWGWTTPGATVTISVAGGGPSVTSPPAGADGRWNASLPPAPISTVGTNITFLDGASGATVTLVDVLWGDVVWCSGQSNLSGGNTPVAYAFNATEEIAAAADYPWVRVFTVGTYDGGSPAPLPQLSQVYYCCSGGCAGGVCYGLGTMMRAPVSCTAYRTLTLPTPHPSSPVFRPPQPPRIPWSVAGPGPVAGFSATCWFHGKGLADALGPSVPIGLVESAWGGTEIQVGRAGCAGWAPVVLAAHSKWKDDLGAGQSTRVQLQLP